ncbi:MAG: hypothetical protein AB7G23_20135 [Vicinamibacterales bacterium]
MDTITPARNTATLRILAADLFDRLVGTEHAEIADELLATVREVTEAFETLSRVVGIAIDCTADAIG